MFVFFLLGLIGISASIVFFIMHLVAKSSSYEGHSSFKQAYEEKRAKAIVLNARIAKVSFAVGLLGIIVWKSVFYASPGNSYAVQYFTGKQVAHTGEGGFHFRGWGQVIEMKKILTVKFSDKNNGDYSGYSEPFGVRFNDAVQADISASLRIRLPTDTKKFLALAMEYRSQENLVNASLIPATKEVLRNSARMISAQEYILGKGGKFEQAVADQLQNGIYELVIKTQKNNDAEKFQNDSSRVIEHKEAVVNEVVIRTDKNGNPIRKKHAFVAYDIEVTQAVIDDVEPEENFKKLLAMQRDAAGRSNVARQEAQQAEFQKQKIIAEGETKKATIRVQKEEEQIEILVGAETEMKKKKTEVEQQKYAVEAAELAARATKITAEAEAYARERKMKADNALEQRLNALIQINAAYAEAIKGTQMVPTTVIGDGGAGNSAMGLVNLLTANAAQQVNKAMSEK
jgi:regulator of protease activity HflC (stomatin/prohibitin superfamily)